MMTSLISTLQANAVSPGVQQDRVCPFSLRVKLKRSSLHRWDSKISCPRIAFMAMPTNNFMDYWNPIKDQSHFWTSSNIHRCHSNARYHVMGLSQSWLPPKVLLLCRSWGACVPRRSQRLCQLEFWLLVGTTMLDRLWARGQTKCNTPLMLATSVFGWIHRGPCYVMAQPKSRLDIPWPNDAEYTGHVWCHLPCWYPLFCDVESLAGWVGG